MQTGQSPSLQIPRRGLLRLAGLGWLTSVGHQLAVKAEDRSSSRQPARSLIVIRLAGGPSQLETFDPQPGTRIAAGTKAIPTAVKGIQLAEGLERLADAMPHLSLIRSMVSPEGDHERGSYLMTTGYRPDPTVEHPSLGAICCHELAVERAEIPRHISILPGQWPSRGGLLGPEFDAFQTGDPRDKLPDLISPFSKDRDRQRLADLDVVERTFARGRSDRVRATQHRELRARARRMMDSSQLEAFEVDREPRSLLADYGDTPFGRGCLAARRLIEVGVRCVEVTLDGWDSHANNHAIHRNLLKILDPAFSAMLRDLASRDLLDRTVVLCAGEFGRTPVVNVLGGRDHWAKGYSIALAGGGLRGGRAIGETDPEGQKDPARPVRVEDVHATILKALGIDHTRENTAKATGRPIKLSEGRPVAELLGRA